MYLSRHLSRSGPRWYRDGSALPQGLCLELLLELSNGKIRSILSELSSDEQADGEALVPIEPAQEVWAAGVTYLRSREAREHESATADIYQKVYDAERPELFPKAAGWRVVGDGQAIRVRSDSAWNVPEPELVVVINNRMEIVGYCAGNDVSSRAIEGENPLYLPQAKIFDGSCALGPGLVLCEPDEVNDLPVSMVIDRANQTVFEGETRTSQMKRPPADLADHLGRELEFPRGAFLMTGTGIVPPDEFSLQSGDQVRITVSQLTLTNTVE